MIQAYSDTKTVLSKAQDTDQLATYLTEHLDDYPPGLFKIKR